MVIKKAPIDVALKIMEVIDISQQSEAFLEAVGRFTKDDAVEKILDEFISRHVELNPKNRSSSNKSVVSSSHYKPGTKGYFLAKKLEEAKIFHYYEDTSGTEYFGGHDYKDDRIEKASLGSIEEKKQENSGVSPKF